MTRRQPNHGTLFIIGGAEDWDNECAILRAFVRAAGGARARIAIIAVASEQPAQIGAQYVEHFKQLGAREARLLALDERGEANHPDTLAAVSQASAVFFTGGNQLRITQVLGGTRLDAELHQRLTQGLVLAGTSAGAAMMSSIMIAGGLPRRPLRAGSVELSPGMDFISGVLIDQHFEERGRLRRLLSAVAQHPHNLGLGIDEDTAVVVKNDAANHDYFEVVGSGMVTVIDASELSYFSLPSLSANEPLALCGVKVHLLPAGYGFNFAERAVITELPPRREAAPGKHSDARRNGGPANEKEKKKENGRGPGERRETGKD